MSMPQFHAYGEVAQIFGWLDGTVKPPREAIIEGAAGGGKTRLIGEWIKSACNLWPDSKGLVLRDTRVSLNESFLDIWENYVLGPEHPAVIGGPTKMHRQSYKHPALGAEVVLGGMDNPTKIFSTEYSWIFFNECQQTTKTKWESLHRALRRTSSMPFRVLIGDCNPEEEFHWANQRMIDGQCQRIISRLWDNPRYFDHAAQVWTPDGIDYATRLCENMSGVVRERLYFGKWVSAHGQVWPDYDPRVHVKDGALVEIDGRFILEVEGWEDPVELVYFVGGQDIGHSVPGSAQVYGCDREGRMYLVAQIHQTEKDHDWWGQRWIEFNDEFPIKSIICDHDMAFIASLNRRIRGRGEDGMPGIARPANKNRGKGQEKVGIDDVRVRMKQRPDGTRGWYILRNSLRWGRDPKCIANSWPTCLEQEIPAWRYPDASDGGVLRDEPDPSIRDDACDCTRYVAQFLRDRTFGIKAEGRICKPGSLNDRLGYNKFFRRHGFRFDRKAQ